MSNLLKATLVIILLLAVSVPVMAETDVTIKGEVRVRTVGDRTSIDTTYSHMSLFTTMRTRVGIKAKVDDNAFAFVQFRDSRLLGGQDVNGDWQSSTQNYGYSVDLHQAYFKANFYEEEDMSLGFMAGRFEFNLGNQRVFGAVGWSDIGRTWEGGLLWMDKEKFNVTLAHLKINEELNPEFNQDACAYGFFVDFKEYNTDLFLLWEKDYDTTIFGDLEEGITNFDRKNFGLYYERQHEQFDFEITGVYQTGTMAVDFDTEADIAAYMLQFEAGYTMTGEKATRFALGIDYSSGDDGTDAEINTYDNLYYTGHKFRGYMDYFGMNPTQGLMDLYAKAKFELMPGWYAMADFHIFQTAEDYLAEDGSNTKSLGTELDLTVKTNRIKGINMMWGISYFGASDDFAYWQNGESGNNQSGFWIYEQASINF